MKKILILITLVTFFCLEVVAQIKPDTIISNDAYKSYFSYKFKEPLYVSYKLYKGGGECSRAAFHFKNDTKIVMAKQSDYSHNGYDEGHLANAEDFAGDCTKDELTFRFYNCLPQTANLNRGIWKHWETIIRNESQTDSLFIICGGIFQDGKTMGDDKVAVPNYCFKIVKSLSTKRITHIFLFTNKEEDNICEIKTLNELEEFSEYKFEELLK
jgi:endonuclease G